MRVCVFVCVCGVVCVWCVVSGVCACVVCGVCACVVCECVCGV